MSKKVIWALFDDGAGSGRNCGYDKEKYQIISIGIKDNDGEDYYKIDLRSSNDKLIRQLNKLPKPGAIVASPPCESGSNAGVQYRMVRGIDTNTLSLYSMDDYYAIGRKERKNINYNNKGSRTLIGIDTATATDHIIKTFEPEYGIIENPQSSLIWKFFYKFGEITKNKCRLNLAYYNNYNNDFPKKPTYFFSNVRMDLKHEHIKNGITVNPRYAKRANIEIRKVIDKYDEKSKIPSELLLHILKELENYEYVELFSR